MSQAHNCYLIGGGDGDFVEGMEKTTGIPMDAYPDWVAPVIVLELRQGLRRKLFASCFLTLHLMGSVALFVEAILFSQASSDEMALWFDMTGVAVSGVIWSTAWALLVVVVPLIGLTMIAKELEGKNNEALLMSGLPLRRLVSGKWLMLCLLSGLIVLSLLPYLIARYFFGGVELGSTFMTLCLLLSTGAAANALALGVSGVRHFFVRITLFIAGLFFLVLFAFISVQIFYLSFGSGGALVNAWISWPCLLGNIVLHLLYIQRGLTMARRRIKGTYRGLRG